MSSWLDELMGEELRRRAEGFLLRARNVVERMEGAQVKVGGKSYVNFASNDYLGLSGHPLVIEAMKDAVGRAGAGSGASGLVSGYSAEHAAAEEAIARWKGTEASVLLPSGYQSSMAAIQTLAGIARFYGGGVRFLIDKLAHASLVDAVTGSGQPYRVFPHNGMEKLERLLNDAPEEQVQIVVTESIFSMDGDAADLRQIGQLKKKHRFVLLLDEAHGSGVYGKGGAGLAAEMEQSGIVDVSIATLSKAAGVMGGAICGSKVFCDAVVNWGRAYIYSTSVAPAIAAGARAAIEVMRDEPWRQRRVRELAGRVRSELKLGTRSPLEAESPIIPIVLGSEKAAMEAAEQFKESGLLVVAIRPPTVPPGGSRLRITLSCEHRDEDVERLIEIVATLKSDRA